MWLKHTLAWVKPDGAVAIGYRPVHLRALSEDVRAFPPKARVY